MTDWKIDKHIPVAVVLALMVQTAGIVWWAATQTARLDRVEEWQAKNDAVRERIVVIETQLLTISSTLGRIEKSLAHGGGR